MIYTKLTKQAIRLCFHAHADQVDKSGLPYVLHPLHLAEQMGDEITTVVALLTHDPAVPYMEYVARIGQNPVARAVKLADLRHNSDITRLDCVTHRDLDRVEKYRQAMQLLEKSPGS